MRGSPEHLLFQEANVLTEGREGSRYRKRSKGAEGLEPRQDTEKPGGRKGSVSQKREGRDKVRP